MRSSCFEPNSDVLVAAIDKGKGVVEVLSQLGSSIGKNDHSSIEGAASVGALFAEMSRICKLFEMFYANFVRSESPFIKLTIHRRPS